MEPRTSSIKILYNNKDISVDISKYLKSINYTDNLSGEADDLQITLEDRQGLWQSAWMPEKGAILAVSIMTAKWNNLDSQNDTLRLGSFEIDEITSNGNPQEVQIKAVSVPDNSGLRGEEKSRSWEKTKLYTIATDIAIDAGVELYWDTDYDSVLERVEQTEETDLAFLAKLCSDKGLALKISDNTIIIFDEEKYEATSAKITIVKPGTSYTPEKDMIYIVSLGSYSLSTKIRDVYAACTVTYQKSKKKSKIEATFSDPDKTGKTLKVKEQVESTADAERLAKKKLRDKNKNETTGSVSAPGSFLLLAGTTVNLLGYGKFDGRYLICKAYHDKGPSYTARIDIRRCLNGY